MTRFSPLIRKAARLARSERGVVTVYNLFFTITACCIGAVAVDVTRAYEARSQLQVSADLGAHAALYTRRYGRYESGVYYPLTDAAAETAAIDAVEFGAPDTFFGETIDAGQIVLGYYDHETGYVNPSIAEVMDGVSAADLAKIQHVPDSAAVITDRAGANSVRNFLFRMAGLPEFNVATGAVFTLGPGECDPTQGFFSQRMVEVNGRNNFYPGFCVGAPRVWIRNQNQFRPGVSVVTKTASGLELSGSDPLTHNPGLMEAWDSGDLAYNPISSYMTTELNRVTTELSPVPSTIPSALVDGFNDHNYAYDLLGRPGWTQVVTNRAAAPNTQTQRAPFVTLTGGSRALTPSDFAPNRVNYIQCGTSGPSRSVTLRATASEPTFSNMAIFTNCRVSIDGNAKLEDFVLSTSSTASSGSWAINTSSGLTVGRDDNCAPTGGAALITLGGFQAAAQIDFYGAHIRALDEVDFQSNAVGEGVSIVSGGGKVDTNSRINMAVCGPGAGAVSRDVSLYLLR